MIAGETVSCKAAAMFYFLFSFFWKCFLSNRILSFCCLICMAIFLIIMNPGIVLFSWNNFRNSGDIFTPIQFNSHSGRAGHEERTSDAQKLLLRLNFSSISYLDRCIPFFEAPEWRPLLLTAQCCWSPTCAALRVVCGQLPVERFTPVTDGPLHVGQAATRALPG